MEETLLLSFEKHHSWVGLDMILDHLPIWLQLDTKDGWKPLLFKFNHNWLTKKDFWNTVYATWIPFSRYSNINPSTHLQQNLKDLKLKAKLH